jgi:hypothetical protein
MVVCIVVGRMPAGILEESCPFLCLERQRHGVPDSSDVGQTIHRIWKSLHQTNQ